MRDEPAQMQTAPQLVQAKGLFIVYNMVAPRGIEPRTQRFSVSCSTN